MNSIVKFFLLLIALPVAFVAGALGFAAGAYSVHTGVCEMYNMPQNDTRDVGMCPANVDCN